MTCHDKIFIQSTKSCTDFISNFKNGPSLKEEYLMSELYFVPFFKEKQMKFYSNKLWKQ